MDLHQPFFRHRGLASARHYAFTSAALGTTATVAIYSSAAAIAASAVGTGLSMYGQQQQAESAAQVANYNYLVQKQNAEINARVSQQQAQWQQQSLASQRQVQINNAAALDAEALARQSQGREEARRMRQEKERVLATQSAKYAKSGVQNEGTPLAVMAETAGLIELQVQDAAYKTEMESRSLERQAVNQRYAADSTLFDIGLSKYEEAATEAGYSITMNQAKVDKLAGLSQASGYKTASYGTLISGFKDSVGIGLSGVDSVYRYKKT